MALSLFSASAAFAPVPAVRAPAPSQQIRMGAVEDLEELASTQNPVRTGLAAALSDGLACLLLPRRALELAARTPAAAVASNLPRATQTPRTARRGVSLTPARTLADSPAPLCTHP